jgi:integrase
MARKTLHSVVVSMGGISRDRAGKAGYDSKTFLENRLRGIFRKGGRSADDLASEIIGMGIIPPCPDNMNTDDWLIKCLMDERQGFDVTIEQLENLDKLYAAQEREALKELEGALKDEGKTEREIEAVVERVRGRIEEEEYLEAYYLDAEEDEEVLLANFGATIEKENQPTAAPAIPSTWPGKVFRQYLTEKGLSTIPANPWELEDYVPWLRENGYKATSIVALLAPVREMYRRVGIETKRIVKGPKNRVTFLRDPLSEEDARALMSYAETHCSLRDCLIVKLMLYLGLRDVEISRMDAGDFFPFDDTHIVKLWRKGHTGKDIEKKVSGGLLKTFLEYQEQESSTSRKPSEPMFLGAYGDRIRPDVVSRTIARIMKKAGVKNASNSHRISPHSLRHTAITKVAKETKNSFLIMQFADHEDLRYTKPYLHHVESPELSIKW